MGPIGAKQSQMVPNDAKQSQTGPNGVKRGQKGPKSALRGQMWPKGPMGPNEAKWGHMGLIFCMHAYFYEIKKSCLQPRLKDENWPSYGDFVDSKILIGLH